MNEKRLSGNEDFRCRQSLRGCKTSLPLVIFPPVISHPTVGERGGEHSFPPDSHAAHRFPCPVPSPPPPPRRHPRPDSSLENAPFSGGKARTTYFAPLSEVFRHRLRCTQPGVEIHSSCPTLRVAVHEVMPKQLVARLTKNVLEFLYFLIILWIIRILNQVSNMQTIFFMSNISIAYFVFQFMHNF